MNDRLRVLLGISLIIAAFGWANRDKINIGGDDKLAKPSPEMVEIVSNIYEVEGRDSAEYSGMFYAMWQEYDRVPIKSNLQLQYYLKYLGDEVLEGENSGKYPEWSPSVSEAIAKVIGKQDETELLTEEEQKNLKELFYAFAWKMYNPEYDSEFEEYKGKAVHAIKVYSDTDDDDTPAPEPESEDCICEGAGYVVHGDGHKTPCPCVESGEDCEHNPKCGYSEPKSPAKDCEDSASKPNMASRRGGFLYRLFGDR